MYIRIPMYRYLSHFIIFLNFSIEVGKSLVFIKLSTTPRQVFCLFLNISHFCRLNLLFLTFSLSLSNCFNLSLLLPLFLIFAYSHSFSLCLFQSLFLSLSLPETLIFTHTHSLYICFEVEPWSSLFRSKFEQINY